MGDITVGYNCNQEPFLTKDAFDLYLRGQHSDPMRRAYHGLNIEIRILPYHKVKSKVKSSSCFQDPLRDPCV